jgi:hypothetical protein
VKYAVLSEVDESYLDTGTATVNFILTCMRADYDIVLYVRDWAPLQDHHTPAHLERAVAVARSNPIRFADAAEPLKARVTHAGPQSGWVGVGSYVPLRVQWSSGRGAGVLVLLDWMFPKVD